MTNQDTMQNASFLERITHELHTQDNRATSDPMFIVQERKRIYGLSLDYTDDYVWIDTANDHTEATAMESDGLDRRESRGDDTGDWVKVGYVDHWHFVTACFTEQGCKDYITANGHNLTDPRIYAASAYRNSEFTTLRKLLLRCGKLL